jgi:PKD repeat protein
VVLLIVAGLTIGTAPAASQSAAESIDIEDVLEETEVPTAVAPGEPFTVDATAIDERDDVAAVCWRFNEADACHDAAATYAFEEVGPHTATLIVTDEDGERSSATALIVTTTAPTAALDVPETVEAGTEFRLDAGDSTDDHGIERYEWDLNGDGTVDETTTSPTVTHAFETAGAHELTVTTVDAAEQRDTATATIDVAEDETVAGSLSGAAIGIVLMLIGSLSAVASGAFLLYRLRS